MNHFRQPQALPTGTNCSKHFYFSRWAALGSCLFVASVALVAYAFGAFSEGLQQDLGYDQQSLDIIESMGETGLFLEVICGIFMDYHGPRFTFFVSIVLIFSGYHYIYLAATHAIASTVASVGLMFLLASLGASSIGCVSVAVGIRNFPAEDRGKVAGLVKAYLGLSSAVIAQLYSDFFDRESADFFGFLSIYIPIMLLIAVVQINILHPSHIPYETDNESGVSLNGWFFHLFVFLLYTLTVSVLNEIYDFPKSVRYWFGIGVFILQTCVLCIPLFYGKVRLAHPPSRRPSESQAQDCCDLKGTVHKTLDETEQEPLLHTISQREYRDVNFLPGAETKLSSENVEASQHTMSEYTLLQALQTSQFWVVFLQLFSIIGSSLIIYNNLPAIAKSLGFSSSSFYVSIIGLSNCLGRVTCGWLSDLACTQGFLSRSSFICWLGSLTGFSYVLFLCTNPAVFVLGLFLAGFFSGGMTSLVTALTADLFGTSHIASTFGALSVSRAFGSFFFATWFVNLFYSNDCSGCFSICLVVAGLICQLTSLVTYMVLVPGHNKSGSI